jgi:hypothetical protein
MSRRGRLEDTSSTTGLNDSIRKEFPDAFFYDLIWERRVGQTRMSRLSVALETIDKMFKHGFEGMTGSEKTRKTRLHE